MRLANIYENARFQGRLLTPELCAKQLNSVILAWYNANPENLTLVSGLVSGARDLTSRGNNATQATSGNRLTYFPQDPMFGNRSSFGSTTSNGSMHLAVASLAVRHIFWGVYYKDGVDTTFDTYSFFIAGPGALGANRVMSDTAKATLISSSAFATTAYKNGSTSASATVLPLPASVMRCDGNTTQTWQIGGSSVSANRIFVGGFRNVVLCGTVLSSYQIQLIEGTIAWDGGHQGLLTADHFFKNRPPMIGD